MKTANLHHAKTHLSRLVDAALTGEEVVIARAGTPVVRLVPIAPANRQRELGLDAGKIIIHEGFDDPMPELEDLFYGEKHGEADPG
ncbi:MAG: type II toxin-antitoxin system Phd/YefM family antitoxin [Acidobacteriota bacterium]